MIYLDLREYRISELKELQDRIELELERRRQLAQITYHHQCFEKSLYHRQKHHWAKLITSIDQGKDGQYIINGTFLPVHKVSVIKKNSIVIERCNNQLTCFKVVGAENQKVQLAKNNTENVQEFILDVVQAYQEEMQKETEE